MTLIVQSSAFGPNALIPRRYTADGEDVSPPMTWSGAPPTTKEFALICDDPDAPSPQPWVHWVVYKMPATALALPETVAPVDAPADPAGALHGRNSWNTLGYRGPAPPRGHGVHHYHFQVYALDATIALNAGATKEQLLSAMRGHVVAQGELVGTYQR
jgi:Raf kinase inhibitor-like YbhB/YbcL family protein